ncbi:YcjF family protein [Nisaea acidiphila]|uniref:YcjF family protein n=1 Tax=Nisaea acidiphila TaxID=1862145 RepID=A0A9J7AQ23_9PROT|nr:YcjF family protein [Nisaea acidiphila]UUX48460.1 YcjF family protein [Nisaea acidiphila]
MTEDVLAARRAEASSIVSTYMGWTAGASFIPVPWVDLAAVTVIQIKMVGDLASLYQVPFSRNVVKTIIAGLLGSLVPAGLARGASSLLKAVPGIGTWLGVLTAPVFTSASTYAIGKVFVQHFEAGGTVLDFDPDAMRDHFKAEFEEGVKKSTGKSNAKAAA